MAEKQERKRTRKPTTGRSAEESAERRATRARQQAEQDRGAMDNPVVADEPSEIRHAIYFVGVLGFALVLNLAVLIVVSGGR